MQCLAEMRHERRVTANFFSQSPCGQRDFKGFKNSKLKSCRNEPALPEALDRGVKQLEKSVGIYLRLLHQVNS